ncbi:MAG: hypothetical protein M0Z69_11010 [Actinomycetota bacterium]|nr:hypothetical protein [Actinomycetota bacterium]
MTANLSSEEAELLDQAVAWLQSVLPPAWGVAVSNRTNVTPTGPVAIDAVMNLTTQQGVVQFLVEAKRNLMPKDAEQLFSGLARRYRQVNPFGTVTLVVAPWLSPRTREVLTAEGINYIDLTGNARIEVPSPALFLRFQGADRDPNPAPRGKARVRGPRAGRLIRFLVDVSPPYSVSEVASTTGLNPGYASRLLDSLDEDALIERGKRGVVTSTDISALLRRWTETYDVFKTNRSSTFVAPPGPAELLRRIANGPEAERVVVTGSFAAVRWAPVAAPALLVAYVQDLEAMSQNFALLPADRGANVALLRPFDDVVWSRRVREDGISYAAPSQVAADCLTGNGRMPAEGDALLTWMIANESVWRAPCLAAAEKDDAS